MSIFILFYSPFRTWPRQHVTTQNSMPGTMGQQQQQQQQQQYNMKQQYDIWQ